MRVTKKMGKNMARKKSLKVKPPRFRNRRCGRVGRKTKRIVGKKGRRNASRKIRETKRRRMRGGAGAECITESKNMFSAEYKLNDILPLVNRYHNVPGWLGLGVKMMGLIIKIKIFRNYDNMVNGYSIFVENNRIPKLITIYGNKNDKKKVCNRFQFTDTNQLVKEALKWAKKKQKNIPGEEVDSKYGENWFTAALDNGIMIRVEFFRTSILLTTVYLYERINLCANSYVFNNNSDDAKSIESGRGNSILQAIISFANKWPNDYNGRNNILIDGIIDDGVMEKRVAAERREAVGADAVDADASVGDAEEEVADEVAAEEVVTDVADALVKGAVEKAMADAEVEAEQAMVEADQAMVEASVVDAESELNKLLDEFKTAIVNEKKQSDIWSKHFNAAKAADAGGWVTASDGSQTRVGQTRLVELENGEMVAINPEDESKKKDEESENVKNKRTLILDFIKIHVGEERANYLIDNFQAAVESNIFQNKNDYQLEMAKKLIISIYLLESKKIDMCPTLPDCPTLKCPTLPTPPDCVPQPCEPQHCDPQQCAKLPCESQLHRKSHKFFKGRLPKLYRRFKPFRTRTRLNRR